MSEENNKSDIDVILDQTIQKAGSHQHEFITLEHVLSVMLEYSDVVTILNNLNINTVSLKQEVNDYLSTNGNGTIPLGSTLEPMKTQLFELFLFNMVVASKIQQRELSRDFVFLKLVETSEIAVGKGLESHTAYLFDKYNIGSLSLKQFFAHGMMPDEQQQIQKLFVNLGQLGGIGANMNGEGIYGQQQPVKNEDDARAFLKKYTTDLNARALESKIDPLIGRKSEVQVLVQTLARRNKNNAVLVGEPGVGKTAIAEGLAKLIVEQSVPETLSKATVFSLEISDLMAGCRFRGDLEERMKQIINALEIVPNAILFIDEIHTIMGSGAGTSGTLDVANMLKPALAGRKLTCIGSTTYDEYQKHFEKDKALARRFKKIEILEPSVADAKLILFGLKKYYEDFHGLTYTDAAIEASVDLTSKYITTAYLPDKAIDLIDSAGACQRVLPEDMRAKQIDVEEIEAEIAKITKIPESNIKENDSNKMDKLDSNLKERVYGQDAALEELSDAVMIAKAGLRKTNKPMGSFLFTGPTGVGKTESARALADALGIPLIKYDMSEYMEEHSVSKLIGAPPGYVGFDANGGSGQLISDIDRNSHCVLLLDEIEKAHPRIYNILLQITDDGRLTSSSGKVINFRNVVLIMSSNAGAQEQQKNPIGFGKEQDDTAATTAIEKIFSPEFRNRLDAIITFKALGAANMDKVVEKFVKELADMVAERNIVLHVSDEAKAWLAKKGYNPKMGARPLERVIKDHIKKPLARLMVVGNLKNGGEASVVVQDDNLVIQ